MIVVRHSGRDCRNPEHRDVNLAGLARTASYSGRIDSPSLLVAAVVFRGLYRFVQCSCVGMSLETAKIKGLGFEHWTLFLILTNLLFHLKKASILMCWYVNM